MKAWIKGAIVGFLIGIIIFFFPSPFSNLFIFPMHLPYFALGAFGSLIATILYNSLIFAAIFQFYVEEKELKTKREFGFLKPGFIILLIVTILALFTNSIFGILEPIPFWIFLIALEIKLFVGRYYGTAYGGLIGIILAIINGIFLGIPGGLLLGALTLATGTANLIQSIFKCSGEACWGPTILIGCVLFIILGYLIGALIGWIIKKIKGRR